jgi:PAS domain S-box-containing protein
LLKLVNSLLDFSRIEAGRVEASFQPTDLAQLTAELASQFEPVCNKGGVRLVLDCALDGHVYVDREMWEKIVLNLMSNAFKFTLSGEIRVALRTQEDRVVLTVSDSGIGIPPSEMPRLFERFHRVEGSSGRSFEGTGIGLALVQELVKLHGGAIWAESAPGRGSAFHIALPSGSAHLPADSTTAERNTAGASTRADAYLEEAQRWLPNEDSAPPASGRAADLSPLADGLGRDGGAPRVLVADDNADMRNYIRRILASVDCEVETVNDGRAALEAAGRRNPPDLILSDVMMPGLDGLALVRRLRADLRMEYVPLILLSARAGEEARVEGLAAGADDYMVKPFSARELVARVEGSLRLAKARRELARADRLQVELALDLTQDRLRLALESAHMGLFDWEVPDGALIWSPECRALFGLEADAPVSYPIFLAAVHADDRERVDLACRRTLDPEVRAPYDIEFRVIRPDGVRWIMARGKGYFEGDAPRRFTGTVADVSARKEVETRLRILVDELSHRVKNTLAVVQSITEQTFRAAGGDPATKAALIGRLQALAETHTLLTRTNWESVDLAELVRRAIDHLAVKEVRRFDAQGPHVRLTPKASLAMGLVLHELSTNALKYGAWASEHGAVSVRWRVEGENLELCWDETATGRVAPPTRTSFGSRLIRQAVQYDLGGEVTKDFRPGGLFCTLRVPLAKAAV